MKMKVPVVSFVDCRVFRLNVFDFFPFGACCLVSVADFQPTLSKRRASLVEGTFILLRLYSVFQAFVLTVLARK